jgi:1-phosphatidylinositol-4-phosphate 5-kinase
MPHAVEMPSFLTDDTGPVLSSTRSPLDLPSHLRQSHEKLNGNTRSSSYTSIKGSGENGPDQYTDGAIGGRPQMNGDMHHDASLSFLPNGRSSGSSWEHRSSRNDSTISVNGGANGATENGRRSPGPQNGYLRPLNIDRSSVASTNGANLQHSPIDTNPRPTTNGDTGLWQRASVPPPVSTNSQSTGPLTYTSSLLPATPLPESDSPSRAVTADSPHQFSSPPAYPSSNVVSTPTGSVASIQHPGSTQLKHRHTLQVPKAATSRGSRDGPDDAIYMSGRFSPTTLVSGARRGSLSLNRRNTRSIHSDMPHEEIALDEDAIRWAEAVRQKRASKRRRKDEEDDDRVVVGTKVDQNHVNWVTAYNMLTGIRFTVSRTNAKLDRALTDADFEARHKFSFDM